MLGLEIRIVSLEGREKTSKREREKERRQGKGDVVQQEREEGQ
jgi:hypothetical protein